MHAFLLGGMVGWLLGVSGLLVFSATDGCWNIQ
jgi:hypothetical protein